MGKQREAARHVQEVAYIPHQKLSHEVVRTKKVLQRPVFWCFMTTFPFNTSCSKTPITVQTFFVLIMKKVMKVMKLLILDF